MIWSSVVLVIAGLSSAACADEPVTDAAAVGSAPIGTLPTVPPTVAVPSTTSPAATTTPTGPREVTMAFTGDVLIHSQVWTAAREYASGSGYDFAPMFAEIAPILQSVDLAVCHLEVPIAPPGEEPSTFPLYGAPRELVAGLAAAGYDRCSTASNHTLDQGVAGIDATLSAFEEAGLTQHGMARTPEEIAPSVLTVEGVALTHLSYTWSYNGLRPPRGEEWRSAEIDPARIIADAAAARAAGAEVVVVSMHWGAEAVRAVTSTQRRQAEQIAASGQVDLIVGHHAHVVQQIEQINGVWTVFGLGNILSNHPTREFFPPSSQDGMVVTVRLAVADDGTVTVDTPVVHPTWVDRRNGFVIRDVLRSLSDPTVSAGLAGSLRESLTRTSEVVGQFIRS